MHVLLRSRSNTRCSAEPPTAEVAARRYPGPGIGDRKLQITVVREHHGSVDDTGEDVDQQMRGDVDIRPLLFTVSVRDHERRVRYRVAVGILHHYRPLRVDELRPA